MIGLDVFGMGLAQMLADTRRRQLEAAAMAARMHCPTRYSDMAADPDVIDVDARVVEDVPALPAPAEGEKP